MPKTKSKAYFESKIRNIPPYSPVFSPVIYTSTAYKLGLELARDALTTIEQEEILREASSPPPNLFFFNPVYCPADPEVLKIVRMAIADYQQAMTIDGHHTQAGINVLLSDIYRNAQEQDPAKYLKNLVNTESLLSLFANNSINRGSREGGLIDLQIKPNGYVIDKDRRGEDSAMIYSFCIFRRLKNDVGRKKDTLGAAISEVSPAKNNYYSLIHYFEQGHNNTAESFINKFKEKMGIDFSPSKITYALLNFVRYIGYKDNLKTLTPLNGAPITEPKQLHDERDWFNVEPSDAVEHESTDKSLLTYSLG